MLACLRACMVREGGPSASVEAAVYMPWHYGAPQHGDARPPACRRTCRPLRVQWSLSIISASCRTSAMHAYNARAASRRVAVQYSTHARMWTTPQHTCMHARTACVRDDVWRACMHAWSCMCPPPPAPRPAPCITARPPPHPTCARPMAKVGMRTLPPAATVSETQPRNSRSLRPSHQRQGRQAAFTHAPPFLTRASACGGREALSWALPPPRCTLGQATATAWRQRVRKRRRPELASVRITRGMQSCHAMPCSPPPPPRPTPA